ncbi:MAG: RNA-directed polymerase, partial [Acetobacteraceae bacterium]|nr:RNA-directed polymerase [Acetobacteraceae bacterium]
MPASLDPFGKLVSLKAATTFREFAAALGYSAQGLAYILYKIPDSAKYTTFNVPKRSGGVRIIRAPQEHLKDLQKRLAAILVGCNVEISETQKQLKPIAHGFVKKMSIITNAWPHKNRRFVLNTDLENFFPSINFGRVRGYFMKNRDYALSERVATYIAQIACFQGELPQGSPCSPVISNMITHPLDVRLVRLAKSVRCTYSRYADDLTFSTNTRIFPTQLAEEVAGSPGTWVLGTLLADNITRAGFAINHTKTRMQVRTNQQIVTGLTVNAKVNIQASYYRAARQMCHSIFTKGTYHRPQKPTALGSVASTPVLEKSVSYLEGLMSHIHHVKHTSDVKSGRLQEAKETKNNKVIYPAHRTLYKRLLYFKHFVILEEPLVVCEGKTDNIYLRSALKSFAGSGLYPELAELDGSSLKSKIRFLKGSRVEHDILQLSGGSSNIAEFVGRYHGSVARYTYKPMNYRVIVLVDNDSGASPVFSAT